MFSCLQFFSFPLDEVVPWLIEYGGLWTTSQSSLVLVEFTMYFVLIKFDTHVLFEFEAWIINTTIRENIILDKDYEENL